MNLTKINFLKIFCLSVLKRYGGTACFDELKKDLFSFSIEDVSIDLLLKTLRAMKDENLILIENNEYVLCDFGNDYFEKNVSNLSEFLTCISYGKNRVNNEIEIPVGIDTTLTNLVAFKTAAYRVDSLNDMDEDDFFSFKVKSKEPYHFDGRKLGKSKYSMAYKTEEDPYNYKGYAILFVNAGLIRYVGIVDRYDNQNNELFFKSVIKLYDPISILDIRNEIRENFNNSQQKQEFFEEEEVTKFKCLIKSKIKKMGCEIFKKN